MPRVAIPLLLRALSVAIEVTFPGELDLIG
jgi:hypothetical protein